MAKVYMYFFAPNLHVLSLVKHPFSELCFQIPSKEYALTLFNNMTIEAGLQMSVYWNNIILTSHPQYM